MEHEMRMAKVTRLIARRTGLNTNHHARVWCICMDDPAQPPGQFSDRPRQEVLNDPRRLGAFDHLGVIDLRVAGSAVKLWRKHVEGHPRDSTTPVSCSVVPGPPRGTARGVGLHDGANRARGDVSA